MNRSRRASVVATGSLLLALSLGLAACSGDDEPPADQPDAPAADDGGGAEDPQDQPGDGGSGAEDGGTGAGAPAGDTKAGLAARTALGEVDGTVFAIELDDGAWSVTVVTPDGVENEVELAADATTVVGDPVTEPDDDPQEAAERERLLDVPVDHLAVIEAAVGAVRGSVSTVELFEDDGAAVWEVVLDEDRPRETTVEVDARTGEVLRTERDD
ncbi:PepSY domain-containing protein [Nocardioides sp. S-58]|uniref:PepSY domain-containing protein n=1 Tax=Nocardioides renjunii TaxID=3095075 RepID=A0ABU5K7R5_9ACTN|nr:PepSY domain-containing protein [Nocardioides sp. S-58]MDZ5660650.1 PepSY domain-containing protein [Nocardioides sp. S-58]